MEAHKHLVENLTKEITSNKMCGLFLHCEVVFHSLDLKEQFDGNDYFSFFSSETYLDLVLKNR